MGAGCDGAITWPFAGDHRRLAWGLGTMPAAHTARAREERHDRWLRERRVSRSSTLAAATSCNATVIEKHHGIARPSPPSA